MVSCTAQGHSLIFCTATYRIIYCNIHMFSRSFERQRRISPSKGLKKEADIVVVTLALDLIY